MFKKIKILLIISAILLFAIGCNEKQVSDTTDKSGNKKITIVLDWTPNTNHTGLFVAKDKGYFNDCGLDVEIVQPPEGSTTALIGADKAEFGISFQDTIAKSLSNNSPMPITAVCAILQHNTSGVISLKDKNIKSPKDLTGKKYSTWDDPIELAMLEKIVNDDGGDFSKVAKVPYAENIMAQLQDTSKNGSDSGWIYYAWDGISFNIKGLETNFISFADYDNTLDYYTPVIIASNKYLEKNPDEAKKVLSAIKKGYEFAAKNPKEAADCLLKNAPELDSELVYASQEWISSKYIDDAESFGIIDPKRWNNFYKWLFDNKLIEKEIPESFGFTNEYLN